MFQGKVLDFMELGDQTVNEILNSDQRRSVAITLRMFEANLRRAEACLDGVETNGILYQHRFQLPPELQQAARQRIAAALEKISALASAFGLEPELSDPAGLIRGEMSVSWANLIDTQSAKLARFGTVAPDLAPRLDPGIQELAQIALELAFLFDRPPTV